MKTASLYLPLSIAEKDALHFLGYPEGRRPVGRLAPLLDDVLLEARSLARGCGAYRRFPVSAASGLGLVPERADGLVVGLATAGAGIERRVTELLGEGDGTRALLLDAAGSAAAEEAARRLASRAVGAKADGVVDVPCRISPGYGRWPLAAQEALFALLPHEELGVSLSPSMMMSPRKSVSFALWIGAQGVPGSGLSGCYHCALGTCRYREGSRVPARPTRPAPGKGNDR